MEDDHVKLAKKAVRQAVTGEQVDGVEELKERLPDRRRGVFVTLKRYGRDLRGCIGTYTPATESLGEEIVRNASSAALDDPRFPPVEESELSELIVSVDVLTEPKPCAVEDLNPEKYGIMVEKGAKSGLLLPDLDGVDSPEKQLEVTKKKAGISPREGDFQLKRFEVERHEGEEPIGA
ncbi:MAG: AmmeMemoRadiSam system protein A [Candidatus Bipolaricaulota bacterium]